MARPAKKIRFFLDSEFNEHAARFKLDPISIALVPEDDAAPDFYAVSSEFDEASVSDWVRENVIRHLPPPAQRISNDNIRDGIRDYVRSFPLTPTVEIWMHNGASDQVVLAQFFGGLTRLREMFREAGAKKLEFRDTKELVRATGKHLPPPENAHDCHVDARWTRDEFRHLRAHLIPARKFLIE
jgi:hypothetical protein